MSPVFDWALLIMKIFKSGVERYARIVVEQLHSENYGIKAIQNKLKSVESSSRVVLGSSGGLLEQ